MDGGLAHPQRFGFDQVLDDQLEHGREVSPQDLTHFALFGQIFLLVGHKPGQPRNIKDRSACGFDNRKEKTFGILSRNP